MTSVNEMNAVLRDRARIREGLGAPTKEQTLYVHADIGAEPSDEEHTIRQVQLNGKVYIERGYALSLLTDNVMKPEDDKNTHKD